MEGSRKKRKNYLKINNLIFFCEYIYRFKFYSCFQHYFYNFRQFYIFIYRSFITQIEYFLYFFLKINPLSTFQGLIWSSFLYCIIFLYLVRILWKIASYFQILHSLPSQQIGQYHQELQYKLPFSQSVWKVFHTFIQQLGIHLQYIQIYRSKGRDF